MIKTVKVTNHVGESITMELRFPEKSGFLIQKIEGLGPSKADINLSRIVGMDGSIYNSAYAESKNIVFNILFVEFPTIEDSRHNSYKYFPLKKLIKLEFETDKRTSVIYGYVESNEPDIFNEQSACTISIVCPEAYFHDIDDQITTFSNIFSKFEFPFSNNSLVDKLLVISYLEYNTTKIITYLGDSDVGILLHIHAVGVATGIQVINSLTNESIFIDDSIITSITGSGIVAGDDIYISSVDGDKYIILIRGGNEYNILNSLGPNPDWFRFILGDNILLYTAITGLSNLLFEVRNKVAYSGV